MVTYFMRGLPDDAYFKLLFDTFNLEYPPYTFSSLSLADVSDLRHNYALTQQGPTCGLLSLTLCFAYQTRSSPSNDIVTRLLEFGKASGITVAGEVFHVDYLKSYVIHLSPSTVVDPVESFSSLHPGKLKERFGNGFSLLFPYDVDRNHHPGLFRGHRAHWAVGFGFVEAPDRRMFIFTKQGKSRNVHLFSIEEILQSNGNLVEIGEKVLKRELVASDDLINVGLKGKALWVKF